MLAAHTTDEHTGQKVALLPGRQKSLILSEAVCYIAGRELVFEPDGTISGMVSLEGEKVAFAEPVNPATTGDQGVCAFTMPLCRESTSTGRIQSCSMTRPSANCRDCLIAECNEGKAEAMHVCFCPPAGAVECWLLEVEGAMKRAVHGLAKEALTAYPKSARTSWILDWPGQLVLNCSQASLTKH